MTEPDPNDPVIKAMDRLEKKIEPKLEAFHNYLMTPSREPKRFFSTNKRIVLAVLAAIIAGLYFGLPHETQSDKNFFFILVFGILCLALIGRAVLWLVEKFFRLPVPNKYLKESLADLDVKSDEDKARENARNNGPINPDAK